MTNKEPKYLTDFFLYNKRYHWFIIPTIVFFYRKDVFFETGICTPAIGLSVRCVTVYPSHHQQRKGHSSQHPWLILSPLPLRHCPTSQGDVNIPSRISVHQYPSQVLSPIGEYTGQLL